MAEPRKSDSKEPREHALGPGAAGTWTEKELEGIPEVMPHVTSKKATRQDDDPEALREGIAEANRVEVGHTPSPEEEAAHITRKSSNRHGFHPGQEGRRRGAEEAERTEEEARTEQGARRESGSK